ncbi:hypothetical protein GCU67_14665 [Modestobacter muralis]|uniref:Uncharacterized protein n=1 Tax=Modestobacter muralis TaxID=1608614 RepID=A0A6P0EW38_9ACTN|nr:hypothetical protein [Modestobacter muralis]NEK95397.1 hypothetical protein [Modestobacter muralis]NEN52285.1 hypothetical protein [Modestobacter muralis]
MHPPRPDWPDVTERDHWTAALADVAARIERDRGVADPWRLDVEHSLLWAQYGGTRIAVAGPDADVRSAEELFEQIDSWVAFERHAGPGQVLERDRQAVADWRAQLAVQQPRYQAATARVFLDIRATTTIDLGWRVAVHEEELDWAALRSQLPPELLGATEGTTGGIAGHEFVGPGPWPDGPPTRPVPFPQLYLETRTASGRGSDDVLDVATDLDDAVWEVAATVQDLVMEEVHGAWPACPGHWHPMQTGPSSSGPVWRCPADERVAVPIGRLVELVASEGDAQA